MSNSRRNLFIFSKLIIDIDSTKVSWATCSYISIEWKTTKSSISSRRESTCCFCTTKLFFFFSKVLKHCTKRRCLINKRRRLNSRANKSSRISFWREYNDWISWFSIKYSTKVLSISTWNLTFSSSRRFFEKRENNTKQRRTKFINSFENENITKNFRFDTLITSIDIEKNFANLEEIARTTTTRKRHYLVSTLNMLIKSQMRKTWTHDENIEEKKKKRERENRFHLCLINI